jgi:hypothetical protein
MTRSRRVPLRVDAEYLVRQLFLLLGHRVVKVVEGRDQLLQMLGVRLGNHLVGLHILDRVHRRVLLSALHERAIHVAGVVAHNLDELILLGLLGRGDLQLRV